MNNKLILILAALTLGACEGTPGADGVDGANGVDGVDGSGIDGNNGANGADGASGADGANGLDGAGGIDGENGENGADGATGADGSNAGNYTFRTDDPSMYFQIDRMGMPAINTAVVSSKDVYNESTPADDANFDFAGEVIANVAGLHAALDDDLTGLGLVPCTAPGDGSGSCVAQALGDVASVIPDVLTVDLTGEAGFPNGRALSDPAIDVTLAVVLLDINGGSHGAADLVGLSQTADDKLHLADFPYLAAPN